MFYIISFNYFFFFIRLLPINFIFFHTELINSRLIEILIFLIPNKQKIKFKKKNSSIVQFFDSHIIIFPFNSLVSQII